MLWGHPSNTLDVSWGDDKTQNQSIVTGRKPYTSATVEAEKSRLPQRLSPHFGAKRAPKGSSGQAPGSQKGAWRRPKGGQEVTKLSKNRVRGESENMQKVMEGIAKIDFWRPGGGAGGRNKLEK